MNPESKFTFALLSLLVVFAINFSAAGHKYLETGEGEGRENPFPVPDHRISWAAYKKLTTGGQVDYYRFTARKGEEIYASILVPKIARLAEFQPVIGLIGPELSQTQGSESRVRSEKLPLELKEGEDVLIREYEGGKAKSFFEPFTRTSYWKYQVIRKVTPENGTYYLAVWNAEGKTGKYVLAIGEKESFGPADLLQFPSVWWKVRIFAERQISTYLIAGAVFTGLAAGSILLCTALFC